jgi:Glyoxalase/Bleomycin resistance protein/Dioxygenase superfamily
MPIESCIPIIPSKDLEKSLRLWVDGLGFSMSSEMRKGDKLIFCMLRKDNLCFMLNQRAGTPVKPKHYEGIRLYWAPTDIHETRDRLKSLGYPVSELDYRDYGQTEFFLTDDDGFSHCFGVPTPNVSSNRTGTANQETSTALNNRSSG